MWFGERSQPQETNNIPATAEKNSDKTKKYIKPELENFHTSIIKEYPQTNEENLQNILLILDKDLGEVLPNKWFDVIKKLIDKDKTFLSTKKTESELQWVILIIKDEINNEETKENNEETKENNEETKENNEETKENNEETKEEKETQEKKINTLRWNINALYTEIPEKYKDTNNTEDFKNFKTENQKQIDEITKKLPTSISIDDYVKNRFTAIQLSQDNKAPIANKTEFINQFNSFNKLLDIDVQIPLVAEKVEVKSAEEKTNTMSEIAADDEQILAVPSIKAYVQSSKDLISDNNFETMDIDDEQILKIYSQEDREKTINAAIRDEGKDIDIRKYFTDGKLDEDELKQDVDEDTYATITSIVNQVNQELVKSGKNKIKEETNTIMKETIMTNVFKWLTGYFTTTNGRVENFADDFELDMEENKGNIDPNDKIIKLNGTINGCLTGFYYNTKTGELQMDDIVNFDERLYKVGKKNNGKKLTLPTKLPTVKEMRETAKNTDIKDILEQSDDLEWYKENLKADLDTTLSKNFSHTELNKYYIERYNEENIAMQENLWYIFDNLGWAINENLVDLEGNQEFAIETKPNQYKLFHIMDKSMKHYKDSGEYLQLRAEFERFNANINTEEIQDPTIGCQEPLIQKLFNEDAMAESGSNRKTGESEEAKINYTTLYDILSDETTGVIDLKALQTINDIIEKDETIEQHETEFSNNIISKYEARKADFDIDEELSGM